MFICFYFLPLPSLHNHIAKRSTIELPHRNAKCPAMINCPPPPQLHTMIFCFIVLTPLKPTLEFNPVSLPQSTWTICHSDSRPQVPTTHVRRNKTICRVFHLTGASLLSNWFDWEIDGPGFPPPPMPAGASLSQCLCYLHLDFPSSDLFSEWTETEGSDR